MKTKAAVLWELGKNWEIAELDLDPPVSATPMNTSATATSSPASRWSAATRAPASSRRSGRASAG